MVHLHAPLLAYIRLYFLIMTCPRKGLGNCAQGLQIAGTLSWSARNLQSLIGRSRPTLLKKRATSNSVRRFVALSESWWALGRSFGKNSVDKCNPEGQCACTASVTAETIRMALVRLIRRTGGHGQQRVAISPSVPQPTLHPLEDRHHAVDRHSIT